MTTNEANGAVATPTGVADDVDHDHVVHLVGGKLKDTDIARLTSAALGAGANPHLVLHFHGGLVNEQAGLAIAAKLAPAYAGAGRYSLFFVWESGLFEAIRNNLQDIARDPLFRDLVKKAARWTLEELPGEAGYRGAGAHVDVQQLDREFDEYFAGYDTKLPEFLQGDADTRVMRSAKTPVPNEAALRFKIRQDLEGDKPALGRLERVASSIDLDLRVPKPAGPGVLVSPFTEVSPDQVEQVFNLQQGKKGLFEIAKVATFIARVVISVIKRFRAGRDHGLYPTIVEEILGAAYLDKVGGVIWGQMKKDTADAFGPEGGGAALLHEIGSQQAAAGKSFGRITLIGHSTGAIYICNFIEAAARLLPNARFEVIFLAPAVTFERLRSTLAVHSARITSFRMFAMHDALERADHLVPIVYPLSLLYFVSGVVEFAPGSTDRAIDIPIVGMERFRIDPAVFTKADFPEVWDVDETLSRFTNDYVWSVSQGLAGLTTASAKHVDFDDDPATIESLKHLLAAGFD